MIDIPFLEPPEFGPPGPELPFWQAFLVAIVVTFICNKLFGKVDEND